MTIGSGIPDGKPKAAVRNISTGAATQIRKMSTGASSRVIFCRNSVGKNQKFISPFTSMWKWYCNFYKQRLGVT